MLGFIGACVTVNVNFPESAVQKAADDYVKELYEGKPESGKPDKAAPSTSHKSSEWNISLMNEAYAQEIQFRVDTAAAKEIQKRQAGRLKEIEGFKAKGMLGEGVDGLLVVKTDKKILLDKLQKLADSENSDRKELYDEVIKTNNFPEARRMELQQTFAKSFQSNSVKGTWVEKAPGQWEKK